MKNASLFLSVVLALSLALPAAAQPREDQTPTAPKPPTAKEVAEKVEQAQNIKTKIDDAQGRNTRFVRTMTNVQIELTLTDQAGGGTPPEKKTVSMVVSSGSWGRIRSAGNMHPAGEAPFVVDLNVDARPLVAVDGPIQLELTVVYAPAAAAGTSKDSARIQPVKVNQSLTVVLQSGKPLIISQAADPASDRKVVVEVKATVLK